MYISIWLVVKWLSPTLVIIPVWIFLGFFDEGWQTFIFGFVLYAWGDLYGWLKEKHKEVERQRLS